MTYNPKDQTILFPKKKYEKRDRVVPAHKNIIKNCIAWQNKKRRGSTISKRYSEFKTTLGLSLENHDFHSFRHTFSTEMLRARVEKEIAESITGHKNTSVIFGIYGHGAAVDQMREAVHKLRYPEEIYSYESF